MNHNLSGTAADTQNASTRMLYLAMDRFANMVAVGRKGLVYSISRTLAEDSDTATFVWTQRSLPDQEAAGVDMHGASGINSSHFIVVGGPGAYVGMSSTDLTINPQEGSLERSPASNLA